MVTTPLFSPQNYQTPINPRVATLMSSSPPSPVEELRKDSEKGKSRSHPRSCSGVCGRIDGQGVVLRACAGCRKVAYCSRKCQRDNWRQHRKFCAINVEESIWPLVKRALAHSVFSHWMTLCIVKEFGMKKEDLPTLARKPLYVQINVGIEPEDIVQLCRLYHHREKWDITGVKGMLQFHHMAPHDRWKPGDNDPRPELVRFWQLLRNQTDAAGHRDIPVVIMSFSDGYSHHHWGMSDLIHEIHIDEAAKSPEFLNPVTSPLGPPFAALSVDTANYLNMINEQIRQDTANSLRLRAPMRACDKQLIIDSRKEKLDFTQAVFRAKTLREPVYRLESAGDIVSEALLEYFADPDADDSDERIEILCQGVREKLEWRLSKRSELNWQIRSHSRTPDS
ncbi:hypothetical protein D9619_012636 [Psilocybe cf. subviscida]|uniref:MYND-type domain-containing protein n=1 Tax=Psilocybe cf. subviscida TaxID=2480587 RepID=A0A8H5B739_9AGAR|nr:hypothetical protein D9619_012636 [Psilocybe cf. subviscida]